MTRLVNVLLLSDKSESTFYISNFDVSISSVQEDQIWIVQLFVFFIFIKAEGLQGNQLKLTCGSDFLLDDRFGFFKVYRLNFSVVWFGLP